MRSHNCDEEGTLGNPDPPTGIAIHAMQDTDYVQLIHEANVYDLASNSPLQRAERLSAKLSNDIWLKREDLQPVHSFKLRGAGNRIAALSDEEVAAGVVCSSAGNHAQGVALAARRKNLSAKIVMPVTTPSIKIDAVRALGAEVVLFGDSYDEAQTKAQHIAEQENRVFIHPFDDPLVIAGQGTIGKEILEALDEAPDFIVVPIGGGGLMAGIASYVKSHKPEITVLGVEPADSASMQASLQAGKPVKLAQVGTFADGVAVKQVGTETFRLCQMHVDEVITVDTDETCAAIQDLFEDTRSVVEPAGALAVAAISRYCKQRNVQGKRFVAVNTGANMNFDRLRHVAERAAIGKQSEALVAVQIPEEPGSFQKFCTALGKRAVTEFNYRYRHKSGAQLFVGFALSHGNSEKLSIIMDLGAQGYAVEDLSDNELAKLHVRHMVGGGAEGLSNERLYRFRFPERPGALADFLDAVGKRWNISLFHYRNHGSDYGRVLVGIQVADEQMAEFNEHLSELKFVHWDETDNPAFKLFLN